MGDGGEYSPPKELLETLSSGGLAAVPTETVYGLAAFALSEEAVRGIFEKKGRPYIDPLIVHVYDMAMAREVAEVSGDVERLAEVFWPGALTIVMPKKAVVPDLVTAGLPTVGVRMPGHKIFRKILGTLRLPLAAPSANPFGYISPTKAEHVRAHLGEEGVYIVDGGPCEIGVESTILDMSDAERGYRILRPGPVSAEAIGEVLGQEVSYAQGHTEMEEAQVAPGMLAKHYSPRARVVLFEGEPGTVSAEEAVVYSKRPEGDLGKDVYWLSEGGDLEAVAAELFNLMHKLDGTYRTLHIEKVPEVGIGIAVMNRLRRAEGKG